jgi:glutathione S-transferase
MRLIGMLDSPFVRRVAVSLHLMDLPFTHEPVSVFRHFDMFNAINPVVKAPTLVMDDGSVLMDSTLIIDVLERLGPAGHSLQPDGIEAFVASQRIIGLALAACEKSVQVVYERQLRPAEKLHQPWVDRVTGQLLAAYRQLEAAVASADPWLFGSRPLQADITTAIAWQFTQAMVADLAPAAEFPGLVAFSARAEDLPAFRAAPPLDA